MSDPSPAPRHPRRAVVIEPSKPLRDLVAQVCRQRGLETAGFEEPGAAITALAQMQLLPAVVVSGMHLAGISGASLVAAFRAGRRHRAIPVAIVTSDLAASESLRHYQPDAVLWKTRDLRDQLERFFDQIGLCEPTTTGADADAGVAGRLAGRRVLLVEDAAVLRKLVGHMLHVAGANVDIAENGQEAIDACSEAAYDLVLMDIEMPVMDGRQATEQLRAMGAKMPIVAVTGSQDERFVRDASLFGFDAVLKKPVERTPLIELCSRFTRGEV